ncbi:MAG: hypothetical protein ACQUHE_08060 [Bacteroidia bacterium]
MLTDGAAIQIDGSFVLVACSSTLYLHIVPLENGFNPELLLKLQEKYRQDGKMLVHLWEDVWSINQVGVLSRIRSFLGLNRTYHARKAKIEAIDIQQASSFFNLYHLQGFVKAKYYYGLTIEGELMGLASFSDLRPMPSRGPDYNSAELVRFASKDGVTVTGGLSRLIKHFLVLKKPHDLMTYADRDWSFGKGYQRLGFEFTAETAPAYLYVQKITGRRYFPHRLPKNILLGFDQQKELNLEAYLAERDFAKVFNTGNLKYHLYL